MKKMKPIRGYNKESMYYRDRCMMKWQGMLLSEHKEDDLDHKLLNSLKKVSIEYDEQYKEELDNIFADASKNSKEIILTINEENKAYYNIEGIILKVIYDTVFMKVNEETKKIKISNIIDIKYA